MAKFDKSLLNLDDDVKNEVPAPKTFDGNSNNNYNGFPIAYVSEGVYEFNIIPGVNHKGKQGIFYKQQVRDIMVKYADEKTKLTNFYKKTVVDNDALEDLFVNYIENKVEDSWKFNSRTLYWIAIYPLKSVGDYVKANVPTTLVFRYESLFSNFYSEWLKLTNEDKIAVIEGKKKAILEFVKATSKNGREYTRLDRVEFVNATPVIEVPDYTEIKWNEEREAWDGNLESLYINSKNNFYSDEMDKGFREWININSSIKVEPARPDMNFEQVDIKPAEHKVTCAIEEDYKAGKITKEDYENFFSCARFGNHPTCHNIHCNSCMVDSQCAIKTKK